MTLPVRLAEAAAEAVMAAGACVVANKPMVSLLLLHSAPGASGTFGRILNHGSCM